MSRLERVINIFFSSTAEEEAQRRRRSFEKVCKRVCASNEAVPNIIAWPDIPGGVSLKSGQDRIDAEVSGYV